MDYRFDDEDFDAAPAPNPLVISDSVSGVSVTFELSESDTRSMNVECSFTFPEDMGKFAFGAELDPEQVDSLYRLVFTSVENQIRQQEANAAEDLKELRSLKEVPAELLPVPLAAPLVLEDVSRKKIMDLRDSRIRAIRPHEKALADRAEWIYVSGHVVHLATCSKVGVKVTEREHDYAPHGRTRGITCWWPEITPRVREGLVSLSMCRRCKPLGKYSTLITNLFSYSVQTTPPEEMPSEFPGYYNGTLKESQRQWLWQQLMAMTPKRWDAVADLIEWCAADIDEEPVADEPVRVAR